MQIHLQLHLQNQRIHWDQCHKWLHRVIGWRSQRLPYQLKRQIRNEKSKQLTVIVQKSRKRTVDHPEVQVIYWLDDEMWTVDSLMQDEIVFALGSNKSPDKRNVDKPKHSNEQPLQCDHCGKKYKIRSALERHMQNKCKTNSDVVENVPTMFDCGLCLDKFTDESAKNAHELKVHKSRKPIEWPTNCLQSFFGKIFIYLFIHLFSLTPYLREYQKWL